MSYRVERQVAAKRDLEAIFDFLFESYVYFGHSPEEAYATASQRIAGIHEAMESLGRAPQQGTRRDNLVPGLRSVTKDRAIFYFDIDEVNEIVRVRAVFFGGQDHQRMVLQRLLSGGL